MNRSFVSPLKSRASTWLVLCLVCTSVAHAQGGKDDPLFIADSIAIARKLVINPAVDLVDQSGTILDADDVDAKMRAGFDVSFLNPAPTDVWGGTLTSRTIQYPSEGADGYVNLHFDSLVTTPRGLSSSRVVTDDSAATPFRMSMSWNLHSALMNAELLSQLGYTVDLPKRYAKARIRFDDLATRDLFLSEMPAATGTLVEQWLIKTPAKDDLVVELRDFALGPARIATPAYYWGAFNKSEMQNRRVIRALLVPLVLTSIPESINLWTWEYGKLVNERVLMYHPFAGNFQGQTNYDDVRWVARKICALDETHLHKIISAGGYPASIEPLLYEKLKSRRNHLMQLFKLSCAALPVQSDLSLNDPADQSLLVQHGKLLKRNFPGYGFDFIGHDPESPLRKDELFRYLKLRGLGTLLSAGLGELNSKLLDYNHADSNHYLDQRWAFNYGPRAKLNLSGTRKLVSGTYYGSESQVQLVDQVSVSASLGYFVGMKNRAIKQVDFHFEPNTSISRSYLHVKPMKSIKEAVHVPWKDLPVVPKMRALAKLLDAKTELSASLAINSFLDLFAIGENFSIVDSIDLGANIGASMPLPPLSIGPATGKLSLSSGFDHLILRRTMLQRQADGTLQISLQHVKKGTTDFALDYNFMVNVASAAATFANADSVSRVFVIDPNQKLLSTKDLNESLRALLVDNDSSILEQKFKAYELNHTLEGKTGKFKLLPWTFAKYHEEHDLIAYAPNSVHDEAHKRELYSIRDRNLTGSDFLGFGTKAATDVAKELYLPNLNIDFEKDDGRIDPAGSFLGRSHWREVQFESELTPTLNARTLLTVQENYLGWTMTHDRMLRIVKRLEAKAHEVTPESPSLIHDEEFLSTTKLLLYQVMSSLKVSGPGLDNLVALAKIFPNSAEFANGLVAQGRLSRNYLQNPDWVPNFYEMLKIVPEKGATFSENRKRSQQLYKASKWLANQANAKEVIQLVGQENAIFQISITGFRKNDENGDSAYLSASIGETNPRVNDGAFASFARDQDISAYEVKATYLGNGL